MHISWRLRRLLVLSNYSPLSQSALQHAIRGCVAASFPNNTRYKYIKFDLISEPQKQPKFCLIFFASTCTWAAAFKFITESLNLIWFLLFFKGYNLFLGKFNSSRGLCLSNESDAVGPIFDLGMLQKFYTSFFQGLVRNVLF